MSGKWLIWTVSTGDPMSRAVSDTGPINYLILIEEIAILPYLFGRVSVASVVREELSRPKAPKIVRQWIEAPPPWLTIEPPRAQMRLDSFALDEGERATIVLAKQIAADAILMDDRAGVAVAQSEGFIVTGTLGLLLSGARDGIVDLPAAFAKLRSTNFHVSRDLIERLLAQHGK